jgi:hypothetical protein
MSQLYWACEEQRLAELIDVAASLGYAAKLVGRGNDWPVIAIEDPDRQLLRETARRIRQRQLISAALVGEPLSPAELFIAAEWRGRLVVALSELGRVEAIGEIGSPGDWLRHASGERSRDLVILPLLAIEEPHGLRPLAARPVAAAAVLQQPAAYYGRLASPEIGGASALFAAGQEAARDRGLAEDQVLVGEPEALGFALDRGEHSVVGWRAQGVVAVSAYGFSLPHWPEVMRELDGFPGDPRQQDRLATQVAAWLQQDLRFGLAILLRGLADPPVVIPMGAVYEQPAIGSPQQTLAVAQEQQVTVGIGASVPLVLPAWCLNPTFSPPHGPMTATPLLSADAGGTQGAVWERVRRRYRGVG